MDETRRQFPQLGEKVYGKVPVYLDNAATSLRPVSVMRKLEEMSLRKNANVYRAVHKFAADATLEMELAREKVKEYINAPSVENVIFTTGTTSSINLAAFCYGEYAVGEGDEIIVGEAEHHSDIVPWQMLCERKRAVLRILPVDDSGHLQVEKLQSLISPGKTKMVAVGHVSNVLGLVNPIKEIIRIAHGAGVPVLVDGAQGIVHGKVDVQDLDCDFYAFSGHKIYASTGTGVLYMAKPWTEKLGPWQGGGEMISSVSWSGTTYEPSPRRFEAGTPNMNAIPTLIPALETASLLRTDSAITEYMLEKLRSDERITLYGLPHGEEEKVPLFSFTVKGVHHEDLALILDKMGIAVRSGQMCAEPLMDRFGVTGMLRASFAPYNTLEEAEYLMKCLDRAIGMLI